MEVFCMYVLDSTQPVTQSNLTQLDLTQLYCNYIYAASNEMVAAIHLFRINIHLPVYTLCILLCVVPGSKLIWSHTISTDSTVWSVLKNMSVFFTWWVDAVTSQQAVSSQQVRCAGISYEHYFALLALLPWALPGGEPCIRYGYFIYIILVVSCFAAWLFAASSCGLTGMP